MITISGIKFQSKKIHKLTAIGAQQRLLSCDEGDLPSVTTGFLGMQLMHPGIPKRRRTEDWDVYGMHVFDALVELGCDEQAIMDAGSAIFEEVIRIVRPVSEENFEAALDLSEATKDSTPVALSPGDGPATP